MTTGLSGLTVFRENKIMTKKQKEKRLKALAERIHQDGYRLGLVRLNDTTCIDYGSNHNGISFKLYLQKLHEKNESVHPCYRESCGYLGMTYKEAERSLSAIAQTLSSILWTTSQNETYTVSYKDKTKRGRYITLVKGACMNSALTAFKKTIPQATGISIR